MYFSEKRNDCYCTILGRPSSLWFGGGSLTVLCVVGFERLAGTSQKRGTRKCYSWPFRLSFLKTVILLINDA